MDSRLRVTDQPTEASFADMVSGDYVLSIPLFQRSYQWAQKNLDWLFEDIDNIKNGINKSCFLGVIVCVSRRSLPGRPNIYDIVDGQQRLSTLYLLMLAAAEVAARRREYTWAAGVIGTYLLVRPLADNPINTKLVPSIADRAQFKKIWDRLLSISDLIAEPSIAGNKPKPPAPSGLDEGKMSKQYANLLKHMRKVWDEGQINALTSLVEMVAQSLSMVSISLVDPLVAPKIFERLNDRGERVTVADLVRNEVFILAPDDPAEAQHIFDYSWEPFNRRFQDTDKGLEKFLFPYGLIINPNLTKADLFTQIRTRWRQLDGPQEIIADMEHYVSTFLALEAGQQEMSLPPNLQQRINRIYRIGKPSSTFAFIMRMIYAVHTQELASGVAVEVLDVIESFLFRRAIYGIEPTGLHAVFKGLWAELSIDEGGPGISANTVAEVLREKPTIIWPNDDNFSEAIRSGNLYDRKIAGYALQEYETASDGESPSDTFQKEHICPQSPTPYWQQCFGERYEELVNTWGNLVPLTGRMNNSAGQQDYTVKQAEYSNSIFATTRAIAERYTLWTPVEVDERTNEIINWAIDRWPLTL